MKISKFSIQNFKGISKLTLDLDRQPSSKIFTLVGLNESGKTSILEALDYLENGKPKVDVHEFIPKGKKMDFNGSIEVWAEYVWNEEDRYSLQKYIESIGYTYIKPIDKHTIIRRHTFKDSEIVEGIQNIWTISLQATKDPLKKGDFQSLVGDEWQKAITHINTYTRPRIIYYPNFLFNFPEKIYLNSEAVINPEGKKYLDVIQDILSYIKRELTIEKHLLERMRKKDKASLDALESTLGVMSEKVTNVVFGAWDRIFNVGNKEIIINYGSETIAGKKEVLKDPITGLSVSKDPNTTNYYLEFRVKEGAHKFYLNERSLGFKWFFSFLLFTEFRKIRKTDYGGILFLLDEPASNLHSTAQEKLLTTFNELVDKTTLIYTTHSHHMINPEWLSGVYVVRNKGINYREISAISKETNIEAIPYRQFVASNPSQKDYFQPILDALNYQPSSLEKIPDILITEGKNDYYTLKYINKVYLNNEFDSINIFPGTGADTNRPTMALYLAWGRNFLLLLDSDKKGIKAKQDYIKDLGIDVEEKIITLVDIKSSWNGFTTEKLFLDSELVLITKRFDNSSIKYDKSKFNTALQTLMHFNERVNLSEETINNFRLIFLKIKNSIG